jgi:hypothetical protein
LKVHVTSYFSGNTNKPGGGGGNGIPPGPNIIGGGGGMPSIPKMYIIKPVSQNAWREMKYGIMTR